MDETLKEVLKDYKAKDIKIFIEQRRLEELQPNIKAQIRIIQKIMPLVRELEKYEYRMAGDYYMIDVKDRQESDMLHYIKIYLDRLHEDLKQSNEYIKGDCKYKGRL